MLHSKHQNRLGTKCAAKLAFCYRMLCGSTINDDKYYEWELIVENKGSP